MMTSLQPVFSLIWDERHFYNYASYLVCAIPLLLWVRLSLRTHPKPERAWFLIAAAAVFATLPTYHRIYDAKLVILIVPAFAQLWAKRGWTGWIALLITSASLISTADLPWVAYIALMSRLHPSTAGLSGELQIMARAVPVPLTLFCCGLFYLWTAAHSEDEPGASLEMETTRALHPAI